MDAEDRYGMKSWLQEKKNSSVEFKVSALNVLEKSRLLSHMTDINLFCLSSCAQLVHSTQAAVINILYPLLEAHR